MRKCKYCQSEIDGKAKICPNCNKNQNSKKGLVVVLLAIIIVIGIAGLSSQDKEASGKIDLSSSNSSSETKKTDSEKSAVKKTYSVGEYVEKDGIKVSFHGITKSEGSEFNKPKDGNIFVLCEFTIENNSKKDITISSMMCFEAYYDGFSTQQSLSAYLEKGSKQQLDGSVAVGKKINGVIGYEIPADWKELEIIVTPDFWSSKDIKFIANNQ